MSQDNDKQRSKKKEGAGNEKEFLPPLDFSSIVFPLYTQALLKLGMLQGAEELQGEVNLELAKRLIDILELLQDRTRGNLKPEEEKLLETCLYQLRAGYLQKAKIIQI
jgi:hypothetical protein